MIDEITFLKWIIASDKTPTYRYGEARADGSLPKKGEMFLTPRELAEIRLKAIVRGDEH